MRILLLMILIMIFACQTVLFAPNVYSSEFDYELSGVFYLQPTYFDVRNDNWLNPENEILNLPDWSGRIYPRVKFDLHYKNVKFITQTRPTAFFIENKIEGKFITDEAYLDVGAGEGNFFYLGKRNIRDGVAYGANPTDFLGEQKAVDFTKREEERRVERKGNYLVGGDVFLKNITLTAIFAPRDEDWQDEQDRTLLKANYFAEVINTDMSLHLFNGDIPGIGANVSSTVGDNLVLHTEFAFREGSDTKKDISVVSTGPPRMYLVKDLNDQDSVYLNLVVGGSYTFGDGTNLIAEYFYNGDGYNSSEWDEFTDMVKYNYDAYKSGMFGGLPKGNLAGANTRIVNFREMRRNYLFARLSNSTWIENLDGQLVFTLNADDMSFLTFLSLDYTIGTNLMLGLASTIFSGDSDSEFGMSYAKSQVSLVLKYYF
jgi:hypothetical protein